MLSSADGRNMSDFLYTDEMCGCVATFKNQQESDWLGRPGSVSCNHLDQLVDEMNLSLNIRSTHPPDFATLNWPTFDHLIWPTPGN